MPLLESPPGARVQIDGRQYLYFVGTGYLGLQSHAEVIRAACEATQRYGIHSATTRAGFGNIPPTLDAERRIAEFFGTQSAFYFASGYAGNSILLPALVDDQHVLFVDELSHYCVVEAAERSRRPVFRFRHRDAGDLSAGLHKNLRPGQRPLVLSDGVFSVRGTIAPVVEYREVLAGYPGAALLLDDAHGIGVLGMHGRGTYEHVGIWPPNSVSPLPLGEGPGVRAANSGQWPVANGQRTFEIANPQSLIPNPSSASPHPNPLPKGEGTNVDIFLCGTMSKAMGSFGGIIPGSRPFVERIKAASHWYAGASAPMAAAAAATARAIELIMADPELRTRLWSNVRLLKDGLRRMGFNVDETPVPIVCLTIGTAENMQRIQRELMDRGVAIAYMAAYSGLGTEGGLRIAVFATHTEAMIGQLLDELGRLV